MAQISDNTSVSGELVAKPHLLIVDDDRELCQLITRYLDDEGFLSTAVHTGITGQNAAITGAFQLIVLDVMLPDRKGFDVLRDLRSQITTPVLMLTARAMNLIASLDWSLARMTTCRNLSVLGSW